MLSEAFADLVGVPVRPLGSFALKGVDGMVAAFAPAYAPSAVADPAEPAIVG